MKVSVNELTGTALDWAVAQCEGVRVRLLEFGLCYGEPGNIDYQDQWVGYCPSADWSQGGPIVERERIKIDPRKGQWEATIWNEAATQNPAYAPTPLIAAMRCFCASRIGDEIEVPDEIA